jgi:hypothetical protein
MKMNKFLHIVVLAAFFCLPASAQHTDSLCFSAKFVNQELGVFLKLNPYAQDVTIPGQEFYGQLPGYMGCDGSSFCWPVVSAHVSGSKATLIMVNDYGSEDLSAQLSQKNDTLFVFTQLKGSQLKVPRKGKWLKLPRVFELVKH